MRVRVVLLASCMVCANAWAQTGLSRAANPAVPPGGAAPVQPLPPPDIPAAAPRVANRNPAMSSAGQVAPVGAPMPAPLPSGAVQGPLDLKREALERIAPLTEQEILELRRDLDKRSAAMNQPLDPVGRPVRRQVTLDLSPGSAPEVVRAAFAQGSVVSFVDAAGRPWPVLHADNFAPQGFDIATFGGNGVSVGVKSGGVRAGSIAVLLEGLSSPVSFSIVTGQREVDYSVEVQLPRYLPGAPVPVGAVEQGPSLGAADLMNFLLNTPPRDAVALTVDAANMKAWQISPQRMIVRTDALLASPAWQRRQASATGMSVYDVPVTPVVLVAGPGQLTTVRISGFTGTKEQR